MNNENLKEYYFSLSECKSAIKNYNLKNPTDKKCYIPYNDSFSGRRIYIPCTQKQFFDWRNMLSKEKKKRDRESRCIILSKNNNFYIRCTEDCENCPREKLHRDKNVSIDELYEKYEFEFADESQLDPLSIVIKEELLEALKHEISLLDEESQQILELFKKDLSDRQIGDELNLNRQVARYKRKGIFSDLAKKLKDF